MPGSDKVIQAPPFQKLIELGQIEVVMDNIGIWCILIKVL
jgi:hypothetical protein